jgi:hypothetical protein
MTMLSVFREPEFQEVSQHEAIVVDVQEGLSGLQLEPTLPQAAECQQPRSADKAELLADFREFQRLRRDAPTRPMEWRWLLAQEIVNRGRKPAEKPDEPTRTMVRYLRRLHACTTEKDLQKLQRTMPAVFEAGELHSAGDSLQWELEARLLSVDSFDAIAKKLNTSVGVIRAYEELFFNVLDRLDSVGWVTHLAISGGLRHGLRLDDTPTLWRFYGYWGGPLIVDELAWDFNQMAKPTDAAGVRQFFQNDIRAMVQRKVAVGLRSLPLDPKEFAKLMRLWMRMEQMQSRQKEDTAGYDNRCGNLEAFADQMNKLWELCDQPWYLWPLIECPDGGEPRYLPERLWPAQYTGANTEGGPEWDGNAAGIACTTTKDRVKTAGP